MLFVCYNEVAATSNLTKGGCIYDLGDVYDCVCCGRYSDALYLQMAWQQAISLERKPLLKMGIENPRSQPSGVFVLQRIYAFWQRRLQPKYNTCHQKLQVSSWLFCGCNGKEQLMGAAQTVDKYGSELSTLAAIFLPYKVICILFSQKNYFSHVQVALVASSYVSILPISLNSCTQK